MGDQIFRLSFQSGSSLLVSRPWPAGVAALLPSIAPAYSLNHGTSATSYDVLRASDTGALGRRSWLCSLPAKQPLPDKPPLVGVANEHQHAISGGNMDTPPFAVKQPIEVGRGTNGPVARSWAGGGPLSRVASISMVNPLHCK